MNAGGNAALSVTVVGHGLLRLSAALAGSAAAGTRSAGASGLAGTTRAVAACGAALCNDSFRGAGAARLRANDVAAWVEVAFTQPGRTTGTAFGFDLELAVHLPTGWVIALGYISSGRSATLAGHTIHLNLLLDLGTRTVPTVSATEIALGACATTTRCP